MAYNPFRKAVSALQNFAPEGDLAWLHAVPGFFDQKVKQGKCTRIAPSSGFCDWMLHQGLIFPRRKSDRNKQLPLNERDVLQVSVPDPTSPKKKIKHRLNRPLLGDELILPVLNARLAKMDIACPLPDYATYKAYYDFNRGYSKLFLSGKEHV